LIGIEELDAKSKRILEYVKAGMLPLTPELQEFVKRTENLT
jgi:hypothetical protein